MELRARLVHAESGRRVVEVRAREGDRLLGSALGEAADAETAEDRARERLLARLQPATSPRTPTSPVTATSGGIPPARGDHGAGPEPMPGPLGGPASLPQVRQPAAPEPPARRQQTAGINRTAADTMASMLQSPGPEPTAAMAHQPPAELGAGPGSGAVLGSQATPGPEAVLDQPAVPADAGIIARPRRSDEPNREAAPPTWEPPPDPEDWSSDLAALELQLRRLGWDRDREATYLQRAFGHPSRNRLTNYSDLRAYLQTLERLPQGSEPAMAAIPLRRSELLHQCDSLLAQLGWNADQGRRFLERELQAASRQQLNDQQLLHFNMLLESEMLAAAPSQAAVVP